MKRIFFATLLGCLTLTAVAQIKIGETIGDIPIVTLLNAPVKKTTLSSQRGKVVLIEFWATWCSPCVDAMPHLQALQKQFGNKLQIITVSTEKEKRIRQFFRIDLPIFGLLSIVQIRFARTFLITLFRTAY